MYEDRLGPENVMTATDTSCEWLCACGAVLVNGDELTSGECDTCYAASPEGAEELRWLRACEVCGQDISQCDCGKYRRR